MITEVVTVEQLLNLGFKETDDPVFPLFKSLAEDSEGDEDDWAFALAFGGKGMINGEGFYLIAGASLMKLGFDNITDVLIWAQHLTSLEEA